jgi:hypothetical protein
MGTWIFSETMALILVTVPHALHDLVAGFVTEK